MARTGYHTGDQLLTNEFDDARCNRRNSGALFAWSEEAQQPIGRVRMEHFAV